MHLLQNLEIVAELATSINYGNEFVALDTCSLSQAGLLIDNVSPSGRRTRQQIRNEATQMQVYGLQMPVF